jgi:hypothetical protein
VRLGFGGRGLGCELLIRVAAIQRADQATHDSKAYSIAGNVVAFV